MKTGCTAIRIWKIRTNADNRPYFRFDDILPLPSALCTLCWYQMSEPNGQSRLDRIEAILERHSTMIVSIEASIERQERANEVAHERFEAEDKRLLTAQILMNSAMERTNIAVEKMVNGMISLELKMEETTGKLNALINTVDGIIRKSDRPQA
jgi:hypothetical protein